MKYQLKNSRFIIDDWGMSPSINEAALALARKGYLYGFSAIANSKYFDHCLSEILETNVKIGAHLNLTYDTRQDRTINTFAPLWDSLFFPNSIRQQFESQISWIESHSRKIDYIDGHHHIHLYPRALAHTLHIAEQKNIDIRIISDIDFKMIYMLGRRAQFSVPKNRSLICKYLKNDMNLNEAHILKKISASKGDISKCCG